MIIECAFCEIGAGRWNHKPREKRMLIKNTGEHPLEVTHRASLRGYTQVSRKVWGSRIGVRLQAYTHTMSGEGMS